MDYLGTEIISIWVSSIGVVFGSIGMMVMSY